MATRKPKADERPAKTSPPTRKPAAAPQAGAAAPAASKNPPAAMEKPSKKNALRESVLARKAAAKPIAFSLDEVRAIAQTNTAKVGSAPAKSDKTGAGAAAGPRQAASPVEKPASRPTHVKPASIADILGFNPKKAKPVETIDEKDLPEKFRRPYRLLLDLRSRVSEGIELHAEESLKRSAKDDAGDLSAYGQNMAEGGINTFDRDFVLSLVSSEQEALAEIDAALKRIQDGTYGICEVTGKPIAKERLLAVPFTRYSAEAQKEIEKNRYRSRDQAGIFAEMADEGGKLMDDDGGGDE